MIHGSSVRPYYQPVHPSCHSICLSVNPMYLSACSSVHQSFCLTAFASVCSLAYLYIGLSTRQPIRPFINPFIRPFVHLTECKPVCSPVHPSFLPYEELVVCLSIHFPVCLPGRLSICTSLC